MAASSSTCSPDARHLGRDSGWRWGPGATSARSPRASCGFSFAAAFEDITAALQRLGDAPAGPGDLRQEVGAVATRPPSRSPATPSRNGTTPSW